MIELIGISASQTVPFLIIHSLYKMMVLGP